MRFVFSVVLLLVSNLVLGQTIQNFVPTFKESKKTTHKIPKGQNFTFGYLEVLENRDKPNGNRIKLPIYIFKSRSKNPKPDPILYTVGGPGYTSMRASKYMEYYKYLDDRDFILFEQRGTQYAKPSLDCPEWSKAVYQANLPDSDATKTDSLFQNAAKECSERLRNKGIDLNSYTTNQIAADINDLVEVLGIEEYNLLTISYSTKIAQVLLRDYPEKIRSVVMDSPLPLEVNYDEESVENLLAALFNLLSDCENQAPCNEAFPNIKNRFQNYLIQKTETPLEVTIENPITGSPETFRLRGQDLITVFTSSSTGNIADVPFRISKILDGDLGWIKQELSYLFEKPNGGVGIGMRLSVWCSEELPFADPSVIEREKSIHPEVRGLSPAVFDTTVCNIWGVSSLPVRENKPVKSDIPVLLISGEYDNETPVKWAEQMSENLSNSYHLVFKGWKHIPTTNWDNQCAMQAANDFYNNLYEIPIPDCYHEIETPIFKIE